MDIYNLPQFDPGGFEPDEIQARALKTWSNAGPDEGQILHCVIGLAGKSGELLVKVENGLFKSEGGLTPEDFRNSVGDAFYYVTILASLMGLTLDDLSTLNQVKLEGGGHGWAENESEDMVMFNPQEAEDRINEAIKDKSLGSGQFNSVVMGILGGLENHLGCEVLLEFGRNIFKACYTMSVKPRGQPELFNVEFTNGQVLDIQRK